jgi:hypothetical protein
MLKIIFKKQKNIINMYFSTKRYLKSKRYHTAKHTTGVDDKHHRSLRYLVRETTGVVPYISLILNQVQKKNISSIRS